METKNIARFGVIVFLTLFLISFASANIVFTEVSGNNVNINPGETATISFKLAENGSGDATNIDFNVPIIITSGSNTFNSKDTVADAISNLSEDETSDEMSLDINVPSTQALGTYTGTLQPIGTYSSTFEPLEIILNVVSEEPSEIISCSNTGNSGELEVKKIDFNNKGSSVKQFGEDDEWFLFEEIEVEIEIENDGNYDVDNVEVSWGVYDTQNDEWLIDLDEEKDFDLKDGKEETITVSFILDDDVDIDLEDLQDGDHYRFYVTAKGEINDNDSPNDGEDTCASDYESVSIIIEDDFVVLTDIKMPETAVCGESIEITGKVWNIGDRDQDEVTIQVGSRGNTLKGKLVNVGDIDAFDKEEISFVLDIPQNTEEGIHNLVFEVRDEDDDVYENDFDDEKSEFTKALEITTCFSGDLISISAELISDAKAGEPIIVKAIISNNGDSTATYNVNAAGFAEWASSVDIDSTSILVNAGSSKEVIFTFDSKENIEGTQGFFIEVVSEDGKVTRQPATITVERQGSLFGITGFSIADGNAYLWGLGLLNIVLVIIIIIVAIRIARK